MRIDIARDHWKPTDSQLILAITGSKEEIVRQLKTVLTQCETQGKPFQGTCIGGKSVKSVITPIWDGKSLD